MPLAGVVAVVGYARSSRWMCWLQLVRMQVAVVACAGGGYCKCGLLVLVAGPAHHAQIALAVQVKDFLCRLMTLFRLLTR